MIRLGITSNPVIDYLQCVTSVAAKALVNYLCIIRLGVQYIKSIAA